MNYPHPYRYHQAFRGQLERLERLNPGVTTGTQSAPDQAFLALEHRAASPLDLARYNRRLRHLERLIADWATDGETLVFAEADGTMIGNEVSPIDISDAPLSTTYVAFEPNDVLKLVSQPLSRIDGFYVREIAVAGKTAAELTFVCSEPGWKTMDLCLYSDAMEIGSRIVIAEIPLGEPVSISDLPRLLSGDTTLRREPTLWRALSAATNFLNSTLRKKPGVTPQLCP